MKQEYKLLVLIVLLAYVIRVLPYLLGYPVPINDDAMRDYQQVSYLLDNGAIHFEDGYGAFPVLHVLVYVVSRIGLDPLSVFRFLPQAFACVGIVFYFLFLRKYFPVRESLVASFVIAVFGPHIVWTSGPVRETLGLFFFPFIIFLFDRELRGAGWGNTILLLVSWCLLLATHHWSTAMTLGVLTCLVLFFYPLQKRDLWHAGVLLLLFFGTMVLYWSLFQPMVIALMLIAFSYIVRAVGVVLVVLALVLAIACVLVLRKQGFKGATGKGASIAYIVIGSGIACVALMRGIASPLPFSYPVQFYVMVLVYSVGCAVGFLVMGAADGERALKMNFFFIVIGVLSLFFILRGVSISSGSFDPLRMFEFMIFPASIFAAYGLWKIGGLWRSDLVVPAGIVFLIVLGVSMYPPIFIVGSTLEGTPFYDVRSDIRYIPAAGFELIDWATAHGYSVRGPLVVVAYQRLARPDGAPYVVLISDGDEALLRHYSLINDPGVTAGNPSDRTAGDVVRFVHGNSWGSLYEVLSG